MGTSHWLCTTSNMQDTTRVLFGGSVFGSSNNRTHFIGCALLTTCRELRLLIGNSVSASWHTCTYPAWHTWLEHCVWLGLGPAWARQHTTGGQVTGGGAGRGGRGQGRGGRVTNSLRPENKIAGILQFTFTNTFSWKKILLKNFH